MIGVIPLIYTGVMDEMSLPDRVYTNWQRAILLYLCIKIVVFSYDFTVNFWLASM